MLFYFPYKQKIAEVQKEFCIYTKDTKNYNSSWPNVLHCMTIEVVCVENGQSKWKQWMIIHLSLLGKYFNLI